MGFHPSWRLRPVTIQNHTTDFLLQAVAARSCLPQSGQKTLWDLAGTRRLHNHQGLSQPEIEEPQQKQRALHDQAHYQSWTYQWRFQSPGQWLQHSGAQVPHEVAFPFIGTTLQQGIVQSWRNPTHPCATSHAGLTKPQVPKFWIQPLTGCAPTTWQQPCSVGMQMFNWMEGLWAILQPCKVTNHASAHPCCLDRGGNLADTSQCQKDIFP